jgi:all-trans-8'-apo-beta-carotenal 15,15'-oxygenase
MLSLKLLLILSSGLVAQSYVGSLSFQTRSSRQNQGTFSLRATVPAEEAEVAKSTFQDPDMKAYASGYKTVFEEVSFQTNAPSMGSIPKDLRGSYFRSGPAMFSAGSIIPTKKTIVQPRQPPVADGEDMDRMVTHPFEGDGAVLAVTFTDEEEVSTRFRFVRTVAFTNERKKGARNYKSMDSTRQMGPTAAGGLGNDTPLPLFRHHLQPGLNKNRKNTSNTRVIYWGKKLLTMWEGAQPYKLDALALSTEGRSQLGSAIKKEADPFGGKMAYDSASERALFYAIEHDPNKSQITLFEFNDKFRLVPEGGGKVETEFPGFALINDFCATENYAVFFQPNIKANGMQYMVQKEPGKALSVSDDPVQIHLVPRPGSSRKAATFTIPADGSMELNMQFVNAHESGDNILVDAICSDGSKLSGSKTTSWPWGSSLEEYRSTASKKSLWRYIINTRTGAVTKECLSKVHGFFGVINPAKSAQRHRYIYMAVGSQGQDVAPPQGIARFDCETERMEQWMPESYEFCGEPMFAPAKDTKDDSEDAGYILSVLYNGKAETSEIVILKANDIAAGPITRIPLGMVVPHGLFGCFAATEEATWPADIIERRSKLMNKMEARGAMWNEVKSDFSGLGLRFDDMEEYFGDFFN